jgi:putative oxidoreductase
LSLAPSIRAARERALQATQKLSFVGPLVARVTLGVLFMSTGWGKLHSLDKVTAFFSELHIPAPAFHATFVSYVELVGGALLLLGLATRFAAVPLVVSMAVAIITAQADEVHGLADLFGLVEWTYLALLTWLAISGAGALSLDRVLFSAKKPKQPSGVTPAELAQRAA